VPLRLVQSGAALALKTAEHHVFRAVLFSIVLTLAVGQDASLLCRVWCPDATLTGCPHKDSTPSPRVLADDTCNEVEVEAVASVREDGRRTAPGPDSHNTLVVPRFRFVAPPIDLRPGYGSRWRVLLEERPLVIALRI